MTVLSNQQDIYSITDVEIAARTNQLARIITDHFKGTEQLVVVGLLRGSFIFIADLVRRMALPVGDFMTVSSMAIAPNHRVRFASSASGNTDKKPRRIARRRHY